MPCQLHPAAPVEPLFTSLFGEVFAITAWLIEVALVSLQNLALAIKQAALQVSAPYVNCQPSTPEAPSLQSHMSLPRLLPLPSVSSLRDGDLAHGSKVTAILVCQFQVHLMSDGRWSMEVTSFVIK